MRLIWLRLRLLPARLLKALANGGWEKSPALRTRRKFLEKLIADGKLNDKLAKQTVAAVIAGEGTPEEVVEKHGFKIVSDNSVLEAEVDKALAENPDIVEKLKSGNMKPMGAIIGSVMKATRGQADAKAVTKLVMDRIKD